KNGLRQLCRSPPGNYRSYPEHEDVRHLEVRVNAGSRGGIHVEVALDRGLLHYAGAARTHHRAGVGPACPWEVTRGSARYRRGPACHMWARMSPALWGQCVTVSVAVF